MERDGNNNRRVDRTSARLLLSLGAALLGVGLGATGTLAVWNDVVSVTATAVGAARVDLKVQNLDTVTAFTSLNTNSMRPGASTAGVLTVQNNGTVALSYYIGAATNNADGKGLGSALVAQVTGASAVTGSFPSTTCGGTAMSGSATSFTTPFVGSSASPRTLAAGAQETLCVQASLAANAPSSLQSATTNVSFTFAAATSPTASTWNDSVPVSGTTIGTTSAGTPVIAPVIDCTGQSKSSTSITWSSTNATSYRIHYGTGSSLTDEVPGTSYTFSMPASGTAYVEGIYSSWVSGPSNTKTYSGDGLSKAICN